MATLFFFFQAEDGIRDRSPSRGLGDVYKRQVTADAFNNLSDAASSIISFIGVKMAGKPADAEHPFGHGRIEYIAALIVSFLVIEVGFTFFKTSAGKLMHPEDITFDLVPFLILIPVSYTHLTLPTKRIV